MPDSPEQDEGIQSPHDRLVNLTLQQIEAARYLFERLSHVLNTQQAKNLIDIANDVATTAPDPLVGDEDRQFD
jgi:hypothetical protein